MWEKDTVEVDLVEEAARKADKGKSLAVALEDEKGTVEIEKETSRKREITKKVDNPDKVDTQVVEALPPDIRIRLRKLDKLQATYPELLRSYRIAHGRATSIEAFERVLRENTPLLSIKEPDALVEYLNQLNVKSNMVSEELKRVSGERDALRKQLEETQETETEVISREKRGVCREEEQKHRDGKYNSNFLCLQTDIEHLQTTPNSKLQLTETKKINSDAGVQEESLQHEVNWVGERMAQQRKLLPDNQTTVSQLKQQKSENAEIMEDLWQQNGQALMKKEGEKINREEVPTLITSQSSKGLQNGMNIKDINPTVTLIERVVHADLEPAGTKSESPINLVVMSREVNKLQAEVHRLQKAACIKDAHIERLSKKHKTEEDLREEIVTLRENLVIIGQDHVEAKKIIKQLQANAEEHTRSNNSTMTEVLVTEEEDSERGALNQTVTGIETQANELEKERDELRVKVAALKTDVGAIQQLAQNRFKEVVELRELLQTSQLELRSLRQETVILKATLDTMREEIAVKTCETQALEKGEKELRTETTRLTRLLCDRETEIKCLREKTAAETSQKLRLEDERRVIGRDLRRAEADKIELSTRAEKVACEVERLQKDLQTKATLEETVNELRREQIILREEAALKASQYSNAHKLISSMRDQTAEIGVQLREAQAATEALDEELTDCRRLLSERTRETETMRRLLADIDGHTEGRMSEMQARLDSTAEDCERLKDEASVITRRRAREIEELQSRVRILERDTDMVISERDAIQATYADLQRRLTSKDTALEQSSEQIAALISTIASLRAALDDAEKQVRDSELQRADIHHICKEQRLRYDKTRCEVCGARESICISSMNAVASVKNQGARSSSDENTCLPIYGNVAGNSDVDATYLKTILLQFLEQKDNKLRAQLIPVLGKLLRFGKSDEQKWLAAIRNI